MTDERFDANSPTCRCSAYSFPHRAGGGECNGIWWIRNYWRGELCKGCKHAFVTSCYLTYGGTHISECPAWRAADRAVRDRILQKHTNGNQAPD